MQLVIAFIQKLKISQILIIFILQILLAVTFINLSIEPVYAGLSSTEAIQTAEKGAQKVVQDDQAIKDRSDQPKTAQVIEKARGKAQEKLESMADQVKKEQNVEEALPPSQKNYLENLQSK